MNIRARLSISFLLVVAANLIIFSLVIYVTSSYYRRSDFYKRLAEKAVATTRLFELSKVNEPLLRVIDKYNLTALPEEQITVYDHNNRVVYASDDRPDEIDESKELLNQIRREKEVWLQHNDRQVIGLYYTFNRQKLVIVASAYDEFGLAELYQLRAIIIVGLFISLTLVGLTGWFYAGRTLRPITDVIQQVDTITASKLNKRVKASYDGDEIDQLAHTFNRMLDRLQAAFDLQRSFVANASHELRTPLTVITGQIETTLIKPRTVEEHEAKWRAVLETIHQLNKLANGLLQLAQVSVDKADKIDREIPVDEVIYSAMKLLTTRHPDYQVTFTIQTDTDEPDFRVTGDESLLTTAFLNLMENACKFSSREKDEVILGADDRWVLIRFKDRGLGIDKTDLPHIFEPFFRAENIRHIKGHGIGLPLTLRIAQMHNGQLAVFSEINKGTVITFKLPKLL